MSVLPEGTTDDEALRISFAEDLARETLDATEKSIFVLNLRDELDKTREESGDLLDVRKAHPRRVVDLLAAPEDVGEASRGSRLALRHASALARIQDPAAREEVIHRAMVKGLRVSAIAAAEAGEAGVGDVAGAAVRHNPLPEKVSPFARLSRTAGPTYPFRLPVRLRTEAAVANVARCLVRIAQAPAGESFTGTSGPDGVRRPASFFPA
ncbi:MAG: hypothetical protein L0323_16045 [Planctomycetes bacterium]|nr:hypothetical protein [Planctomycetota bacterium]